MPGFAGELAARDNDALRRILCDEIPATFQWLLDSGIRFMGPMPEPPHRKPRMHNVLPNSRSYIYHLERRARRAGVDVRTDSRHGPGVERTRVDGRGDADRDKSFARAAASCSATGDFTNSPELKARFMGPQEAKVEGVNLTATGDGQKHGGGARRAHPERRPRARARAALHRAGEGDAGAPAAALAGARRLHGLVASSTCRRRSCGPSSCSS